MGNIFSVSISCDPTANFCCWGFLSQQANYINKLGENLEALDRSLQELTALKNDLVRRVEVAELQTSMMRLDQVQLWIKKAETIETQVREVENCADREIQKSCSGVYCSKNYFPSYKYGKKVFKMLVEVDALKNKGSFEEVATESLPVGVVYEMPTEPTVGMESMFDQVWRHVEDDQVGTIGLYGMGGVGKTTLLTKIHNKFAFSTSYHFDPVIWIVVSKDHRLDILQDKIGEKLGILNDKWKHKEPHEKAQHIFKFLSEKKFVLLLDDIWEPIEMTKVGIPNPAIPNPVTPGPANNKKSKIIFTTRLEHICSCMDAQIKMKVRCLMPNQAWTLFQEKVGKETLQSHPDIPKLAQVVANECDGLPLAIITVARAMACKKTPHEWKHAIRVLKESASEFSMMGDKVFPLLKFSYDNLRSEKVKSCFLYCALFPEDFLISKDDLLYFWMCEEMFEDVNVDEAKNETYHIIGTLLSACLLEEEGNFVKMHDVIRDMALWLACDCGKENESILVHTGLPRTPNVEKWKNTKRVSLVGSHFKSLVETPKSPNLLTLLLRGGGGPLNMIADGFFDHMPTLRVLDLSENLNITKLPSGVSKLISLQHLNLSRTGLRKLPVQLKACVRLKYLDLEHMDKLDFVPPNLISSFPVLKVLRTLACGSSDRIFFDGEGALIEEIQGLEYLEVLTLSVRSSSCFQKLFSYHKLVTRIRTLQLSDGKNQASFLDISSLVDMKHLDTLYIRETPNWKQLEVYWAGRAPNDPRDLMMIKQNCFLCLQFIEVSRCPDLKDMTWLIFSPNLSHLRVDACNDIEKIIDLERLGGVGNVVQELNPFGKLTVLSLSSLPRLNSIHDRALPFPYLKEIKVLACTALRKLPLNSTSAEGSNIVIRGHEYWWSFLEWEDEDTRKVFLPCFQNTTTK
ncbi:probable disease resistance protein At5g63020 isoform X1 [Pyrus x bretschneideri]|uniref:probable disease resistance protein At5g63020 isoform X1 n=1 Tax=Pyrus x bretschneideri TaxID=225117 RepID=UPI00202EEC62|nr:probable disease resistance protein At5g63020 isoform X1 [Pyrus x bretschneideri]XP_048439944.1 probable disease resistance protein At5g63020 isoform X1 [Pyrus x bretschneideri]XP_048439945.1 probable disease resistance protein At5g63020 isoform X1 [Pyrus x bretschneideri]XP_048439946.1 probable disease resistance protein At5g63020 isoform X1 [Pyrus x bretschneideri]